MAEYPGVEDERRFPHDLLAGVVADIFRRSGTSADDARGASRLTAGQAIR